MPQNNIDQVKILANLDKLSEAITFQEVKFLINEHGLRIAVTKMNIRLREKRIPVVLIPYNNTLVEALSPGLI